MEFDGLLSHRAYNSFAPGFASANSVKKNIIIKIF